MYRITKQMIEKIKLAQGAGGQLMDKLIKEKIANLIEKFFLTDSGREAAREVLLGE